MWKNLRTIKSGALLNLLIAVLKSQRNNILTLTIFHPFLRTLAATWKSTCNRLQDAANRYPNHENAISSFNPEWGPISSQLFGQFPETVMIPEEAFWFLHEIMDHSRPKNKKRLKAIKWKNLPATRHSYSNLSPSSFNSLSRFFWQKLKSLKRAKIHARNRSRIQEYKKIQENNNDDYDGGFSTFSDLKSASIRISRLGKKASFLASAWTLCNLVRF